MVTHIAWTGLWCGVCGRIVGCHVEIGRRGLGNGIKTLGGKDGVGMVITDAIITMKGDWWEGFWSVGDDERREDAVRLIGELTGEEHGWDGFGIRIRRGGGGQ